jgi:hypothetical protein
MIYKGRPCPLKGNLGRSIFLMNNKSKVEMLNYKRSLIIKSLASLSNRRGTEGEAYEF